MDGTPELLAFNMPPLTVETSPTVLAALENNSRLIVVVAGHVDVDHAGVVLAPDWSIWRAVAVPARMLSLEASDQTIPPLDATKLLFVPPFASANPANVSVMAGMVRTDEPSAPVAGCSVIEPVVRFLNPSVPTTLPATPRMGVDVATGRDVPGPAPGLPSTVPGFIGVVPPGGINTGPGKPPAIDPQN